MNKKSWAYDLHIHSALSPCASNDMTPNNIINMALLKGLDVIAITDHNSTKNLPAVFEVAKNKDLLVVPGIEVNTKEEVHLLCYFLTLDKVMEFGEKIKAYLPPILNNSKLFGEQLILNHKDEIIGKEAYLLINGLDLSIEEVITLVENLKGIVVPAHIDRKSYSIISQLGFIPAHLPIKTLEISTRLQNSNPIENMLKGYQAIQSSDAHSLGEISERKHMISLKDLTINCILNAVSN